MTISTVTTERLKEIKALAASIESGNGLFNAAEIDRITSELLAVREAQPVAVIRHVVIGEGKTGCHATLFNPLPAGTELFTAPPAPVASTNISDWGIDRSAGVPILVYKKCSVIESETAEYVLSLIKNAAPPAHAVPDAIEPTYEAIKAILPTANPDEYACCVGADMWNACRAAMLNHSGDSSERVPADYQHLKHVSESYFAVEKRLFDLAQRLKGPSFDHYAYSLHQAIDVLDKEIFGEGEDNNAALAAAPTPTK